MKIFTIIVLVLLFIAGCWFSCEFIFRKKNEAAEKIVAELVPLLNKAYQESGNYPDNINSLVNYGNKSEQELFGIFSVPEIRYELDSEKKSFRLYYYEAPFGPFHGYSSKENEWYYEE